MFLVKFSKPHNNLNIHTPEFLIVIKLHKHYQSLHNITKKQ